MNNFGFNSFMGAGAQTWMSGFGPTFFLLILWSIFWKGLALWHSGRRGQQWWFVAFLFINTAGILEIVYLFLIIKLKSSELFSNKKP